MIGTVLAGKYRVEAQLFADKLGVAYRGRSVVGGASLLILVLDSSIQPTTEQLNGILALSRQVKDLNHPSLVPTIDWLRLDEGVALVSPRCDAIPFEEFCKGGVGLAETVDLASQVGEAVQVARDAGIPHKDLSAHSIFVSVPAEGGQVPRIFFWGYEVLLPPYSVGKKDDKFWGTPEYMAPELCSGKGWNPQSDVYSIGIMLFQMVTGKPPFISANYNTTMKRQIYEKPLPLNLLKRGIPHIAEFEKVVFEALQKVVTKRPESTRALAGMLSEFRRTMLPEAPVTPQPPANWPDVAAMGTAAAAAVAAVAAAPEGTLTFRGLGEAAEQADAEAKAQGASAPATLRFQAEEPDDNATQTFDAAAISAALPAAKVVEEIALPAPEPVEPKEEKKFDKKDKKDKKAEKAAAEKAAADKAAAEKAEKAAAEKAKKAADEKAAADKAAAAKAEKSSAAAVATAAAAAATAADMNRRRIEEQTRQLEETGDDWFVEGHDLPKGGAEPALSSDEPKPAGGTREWRLWALIALVSIAVVALLIWVVAPGTPSTEEAKKQGPAAVPKAESLTKVPMAKTPADAPKATEEKTAPATQGDASAKSPADKKAEEAKKAELAAQEAAAAKAADEAAKASQEAAAKKAADEAAAKAASDAAAKAASDAAAAAAAAKAAQEAAAKAGQDGATQDAARKAAEQAAAQELAAKKAAEEAARKAAEQEAAANKAAADAAAKKAADEAAKKAAADAAAKKAAADAAAKKAAEDAAKKNTTSDDAAKKAAAEAAAKKAAADAAAKKAAADAAAKKAAADAAAKKAAEDAAAKKTDGGSETEGTDAASQAKKFKAMGIKALKKGNCALAIRYFESAKKYAPDDSTIDKFIEKCNDGN